MNLMDDSLSIPLPSSPFSVGSYKVQVFRGVPDWVQVAHIGVTGPVDASAAGRVVCLLQDARGIAPYRRRFMLGLNQTVQVTIGGMVGSSLDILASTLPECSVQVQLSDASPASFPPSRAWDLCEVDQVTPIPSGAVTLYVNQYLRNSRWLFQDDRGNIIPFLRRMVPHHKYEVVGTHFDPGESAYIAWEIQL